MLDNPTQNRLGPSNKDGPGTQEAAAIRNLPRSGSQRRRVLDEFMLAGVEGRTRDELVILLDLPDSSVDPRVWELLGMGWVEPTSLTRRTRTGSQAQVLTLTEEAADYLITNLDNW